MHAGAGLSLIYLIILLKKSCPTFDLSKSAEQPETEKGLEVFAWIVCRNFNNVHILLHFHCLRTEKSTLTILPHISLSDMFCIFRSYLITCSSSVKERQSWIKGFNFCQCSSKTQSGIQLNYACLDLFWLENYFIYWKRNELNTHCNILHFR